MIGVQFDSDEICLSQYSGNSIRLYSERMPEDLVRNDQIVSQETFAEFVKDIKKKGHFTGSACSMVLPFSVAYFRAVSMPPMSDSQLRLNLPYEFKDFVGNDSFKYNFDYAVRSIDYDENGQPTNMELMAAAAPKEALDNYAYVLKKAGLKLKKAIPTEMAMLNIARHAVLKGAELNVEECICSIGMNATTLSIIKNGELSAFKVIDIGCEQADNAIAEIYGIDKYLAASYRNTNYENVLDSEQCSAVYERLGVEITKTINFFRYENPDSQLETITWAGNCGWLGDRLNGSLDYVGFKRRDVKDWLPEIVDDEDMAARCMLAIGAVSTND
jgi:type IV pilus assembly protein PilM